MADSNRTSLGRSPSYSPMGSQAVTPDSPTIERVQFRPQCALPPDRRPNDSLDEEQGVGIAHVVSLIGCTFRCGAAFLYA